MWPGQWSFPRRWKTGIILLLILLGTAVDLALVRASFVRVADGFDQMGLQVAHSGSSFDISWNRSSRLIRTARRGTLFLQDGSSTKTVDLDVSLLRQGRVVYSPAGNADLNVRLEIVTDRNRTRSASLLIIGQSQIGQNQIGQNQIGQNKIGENKIAENTVRNVSSVAISPAPPRWTTPVPKLIASTGGSERLTVRRVPSEDDLPLPSRSWKAFQPPGRTASTQPAARVLAPPEAVAVPAIHSDPLKSNGGLPFIAPPKTPMTVSLPRYQEAVPLRRINILVPLAVRTALNGRVLVTVKVQINPAGKVSSVEPVSVEGNAAIYGAELMLAAITAAREWTFRPGTLNGVPIATEKSIRFAVGDH